MCVYMFIWGGGRGRGVFVAVFFSAVYKTKCPREMGIK